MNYYSISNSLEINAYGHNPQTTLRKGYNPTLENSHWNVHYDYFPEFKPNLQLELYKQSFVTDYLDAHAVSFGLVINERFKEILLHHHLPAHRFYPIDVYQFDEKLAYYWFHFITNNFLDWVDKDVSSVLIRPLIPSRRHEVLDSFDLKGSYESRVDSLNKLPNLSAIYWEKLKFNSQFPEYDILYTNELKRLTLISEKLKNALEASGITGLEYKLFDKIID